MNPVNCQDIAVLFAGYGLSREMLQITPVKGGLINYSWLVRTGSSTAFLLQQINTHVFKDPLAVQENYITTWKHNKEIRLPQPLFYQPGESIVRDINNNYWRAFEFIENTHSPSVALHPEQAKATANSFGKFTRAFSHFNTAQLKTVIPDFHNLAYRFAQFREALQQADEEKKQKAQQTIEALLDRSLYRDFFEQILQHPADYPLRVMHHDAKIANVLFDKATGEVVCPVDFDTVMPGYFFSDLGDMIRSMACTDDEQCREISRIGIRPDYYKAIIEGYLEVMNEQLTPAERKHIHYAGLLMIYMQALRFLTDYLLNDIYYQTEYPGQNLDRANNQLALLIQLESLLEEKYQLSLLTALPEK